MTQVTTTAAHAATALRDAAESTAHTLSGLMGDAHDRLDHLHLPTVNLPSLNAPSVHLPGRHRPSRVRVAAPWIVVAVVIAAVAIAVRRRSSNDTTLHVADDSTRAHAA